MGKTQYLVSIRDEKPYSINVHKMVWEQFAVAVSGQFKGELFYRSVAGIHSITNGRFWSEPNLAGLGDFEVKPVTSGEVIEIEVK